MDTSKFLKAFYLKTMGLVGSDDTIKTDLSTDITKHLDEILNRSERAKGVLTVVLTSTVYKILYPEQDIGKHQTSINGGYSGRTFDTKYITPFLKSVRFPAMAES